MKNLLLIVLLTCSLNALGAFIPGAELSQNGNGIIDFHSDTETGLDWLDFGSITATAISGKKQTFSHSINSALDKYSIDGWRLATNDEVVDLFNYVFPDFTGSNGDGTQIIPNSDPNDPSLAIAAEEWQLELGIFTGSTGSIGYLDTRGLYYDEDGIARVAGVTLIQPRDAPYYKLYGPEYLGIAGDGDTAYLSTAVFMVRESVVPIPAAVWLFGSGLLILIGIARHRN